MGSMARYPPLHRSDSCQRYDPRPVFAEIEYQPYVGSPPNRWPPGHPLDLPNRATRPDRSRSIYRRLIGTSPGGNYICVEAGYAGDVTIGA